MYKLTFMKLKDFTEYDALEVIEYNTYEGQRKFRDYHCNELCAEIEGGTFLTGDVALAILEYEDKRKVLVNGQHQSRAVIKTGITIPVVYQEYSCPSPSDLSSLYRRFDNHIARSLSDILNPEAAALGVTWKRTTVRLVVSAAALIAGINHKSKLEKVKYLSGYLRQGAFVDFLLKDGISCFHLQRAPVVQAMILTWEKGKGAARLFWESVRDGAELEKNDPALVLRNYLMSTGLTKSRTTKCDVATTREMFVKCIHAWNAYRTGSRTNLKYHEGAPIPKMV